MLWEDKLKINPADSERILHIIKKSENWSKSEGDLKKILANDLLKLLVFDKLQKQEETLKLGNQLLNFEEQLTPREINKVTGILYNVYRHLEAYNEITKLIPLLEKYQDLNKGWRAKGFTPRYDIAMINYKVQNFELAAEGFLAQKKIFDSIGNQLYVSSMYNNMGLCYYHLKQYNQAIAYYSKALDELEKSNKVGIPEESDDYKKYFRMVIKGNIADIDFDKGYYEKALEVYIKERKANKVTGEYPNKTNSLLKISESYLALNNSELSGIYADSAIASLNKYIDSETRIDAYSLKGKTLLLSGEPKKSLKYFSKAAHINDSVKQLKISRDNLVAKVKYEIEKKEEDLQKAKQTVVLKEKIDSQQKLVIIITGLLLFIISFLYYKSRKDKNTIERQRKNLQSSVNEKELLLKEVHHRVKNNLHVISGLLKLQFKKVTSKKMLTILDETQKHINSIAIIHEMLYQQEDNRLVPMKEYLDTLSQHLLVPFTEPAIQVTVNAPNVNLSINKAIPIGLMVNELITNSIKHAFENKKGNISISIIDTHPHQYCFTYSDNGKGLPADYEEEIPKTMGFRLIILLAEEMNGDIEICNLNGINLKVEFSGL